MTSFLASPWNLFRSHASKAYRHTTPNAKGAPMPQSLCNLRFSATLWFIFLGALSACDKPSPPPVPPPATTVAPYRPAEVPAEGVLTLATPADIARAPAFVSNPAIQKAIKDFIATDHLYKPTDPWTLNAARPVGDYVLLWISFPKIADGGIDLIYSTKDHRIYWTFLGGIRG